MSRYEDDLKLKLAWQTAYERRTCPPAELLYAKHIDDNLKRHISLCESCRENREMAQEEKTAWQNIFAKMGQEPVQSAPEKRQAGQIWTLKKSLGCWQEDGRYTSPPTVFLLKRNGLFWQVAQIYSDKRLMSEGDVLLGDAFGFAEGWNCYAIKDDQLGAYMGAVTPQQLQQVTVAASASHKTAPEGSILSFFCSMEIEVGAFVAVSPVAELTAVSELAEFKPFELIPGLRLAVSEAKGFVLDIAAGTLEMLCGSFKPAMVLRGSASKSTAKKLSETQKELVLEHCTIIPIDVKIIDGVLTVTLEWLREKPIETPIVNLMLNGVELSDVEFSEVGKERVIIKCTNLLLANVSRQHLQGAKLYEKSGLIIVDLVFSKE